MIAYHRIQTLRAEEILLVIAALDGVNGQDISRALQQAWERDEPIASGTLYPLLKRLRGAGLIKSTRKGQARCFHLTPEGRRFLHVQHDVRERLRNPASARAA